MALLCEVQGEDTSGRRSLGRNLVYQKFYANRNFNSRYLLDLICEVAFSTLSSQYATSRRVLPRYVCRHVYHVIALACYTYVPIRGFAQSPNNVARLIYIVNYDSIKYFSSNTDSGCTPEALGLKSLCTYLDDNVMIFS